MKRRVPARRADARPPEFPNHLIMPPSRRSAHDSAMKRRAIAILGGATLALALASPAGALLTPGRTLTAPASVTALSVTNRVVVYAVGRTRTSCGSVVLWDTPR